MSRKFLCNVAVVAFLSFATAQSQAQYAFDFESGLDSWGTSGFGNGSEFVSLSPTGATGGSAQAMGFGHDSGGFSWDASIVFGPGEHPLYDALDRLANNPAGQTVSFDVTYLDIDLPTFSTFANLSFSLQSDNGFKQVDGVAEIHTLPAGLQTISVSLPLDGATAGGDISGFAAASSFYRVTIALNTDGALLGGTSTVYVDNIVFTPEPTSVALCSLAGACLTMVRRRC